MIENKELEKILLDEYNKIVDIIQSYDTHFFKTKTWGVTLSGIVLSIGVTQHNISVLLAGFILSLSFWTTESWYKMIQNGHMLRAKEIENAIHNNQEDIKYPNIIDSYIKKMEQNRKEKKWLRMMFYSQVMYPHIFLMLLIVVFLIREIL
ncbi:MAG: hypothetical protein WGN25_05885 [Candidatus Electrothrix sp. GW3-4]|uniref:hypothetical protein n=1 Tax=Candidatus Electrothrix sp. GW3-4 TaxID=3126740 RepID=UPI0030CAC3F0